MKPAAATQTAHVEMETQDEIAEIMNEIQTLQQSMSEANKAKPAVPPKLKAVPPMPAAAPAAAPAAPEPEAEATLEEFHGSAGEPSMEETLASMKGDPDAGSLIDSASTEVVSTDDSTQEVEAAAEAETPADSDSDSDLSKELEEAVQAVEDLESEIEEAMEEVKPRKTSRAAPAPSVGSSPMEDGSLVMTMSGKMTLRLQYEFGGQEITISFKDDALQVQLLDGTEFKIPLGRGRKAA